MFLVVTGGSGSGKSAYAESRIVDWQGSVRYYLATMACYDEETKKRIARHRAMRAGKGFTTIERPLDLVGLKLAQSGDVLLECMSNLSANECFDPAGAGEAAFAAITAGIEAVLAQCDNLLVVTNEIFSDGIQYDEMTEAYLRLLGRINSWMAERADEVVEVVCGIPLVHKKS